jgi:hypothetical protein
LILRDPDGTRWTLHAVSPRCIAYLRSFSGIPVKRSNERALSSFPLSSVGHAHFSLRRSSFKHSRSSARYTTAIERPNFPLTCPVLSNAIHAIIIFVFSPQCSRTFLDTHLAALLSSARLLSGVSTRSNLSLSRSFIDHPRSISTSRVSPSTTQTITAFRINRSVRNTCCSDSKIIDRTIDRAYRHGVQSHLGVTLGYCSNTILYMHHTARDVQA